MSTTPNVPYRLEFSVEVPGTPEQVWQAIATAKGMSAWFLPTEMEEREGGSLHFTMGPEMGSDGQVTGWDPPRRLVYEEDWAALMGKDPDALSPLTSEFLVEAQSGGTCVVRVTSSGFGTGAAWESEFWDDMGRNWMPFFDNLRLYLTHFPGQEATQLEATASHPGDAEALWSTLHDALGLGDEGATVEVRGATGTVERVGERQTLVRLTAPVPGMLSVFAYGEGDGKATAGYGRTCSPPTRRTTCGARSRPGRPGCRGSPSRPDLCDGDDPHPGAEPPHPDRLTKGCRQPLPGRPPRSAGAVSGSPCETTRATAALGDVGAPVDPIGWASTGRGPNTRSSGAAVRLALIPTPDARPVAITSTAYSAGVRETDVTNQIDYFEIGSPDPDTSRAFYGTLFGWEIEDPTGPAPYHMVDQARGGLWDTSDAGGANWAIFYVHVEDVQAALDEALRLGATIAVPFTDNGQIEFAHVLDPHGNRFGIWRPKVP